MAQLTTEARFWVKVDKNGPIPHTSALGRCWYWTACLNDAGYGIFTWRAPGQNRLRNHRAHRVAYQWLIGSLPSTDLDHVCHNTDPACPGGTTCPHRRCVNPAHLTPATRRENLLSGKTIPARHAARTHCNNGHPYTPENTLIEGGRSRRCRTCRNAEKRRRPWTPIALLTPEQQAVRRQRDHARYLRRKALLAAS
jgi:hypothetical protein